MTRILAPLTLLFLLGMVALNSAPCDAQTVLASLLPALVDRLSGLWTNNELEFLGYTCFYTHDPLIKSWELHYRGRFTCPGWTSIKGAAETRSPSGTRTAAIKNFLEQAMTQKIVTEEKAKVWLEGH